MSEPPTAHPELAEAGDRLTATVDRLGREGRRRRLVWAAAAALLVLAILGRRRLERDPRPPEPPQTQSVVYVDVAGWYGRTEHEVAVASPLKLALGDLPAGLPMSLGPWRGEARAHDPEVDLWFRQPEVVIERSYLRADGELIWLSAFGSRGQKSYHLFEHTPELCYPLGGWAIDTFGLKALDLGPRPLTLNSGVASGAQGKLVFFYLYVWDSPARDAERGTLSLRIAAPVTRSAEATYAMLAQDFIPRLFSRTLRWSRF